MCCPMPYVLYLSFSMKPFRGLFVKELIFCPLSISERRASYSYFVTCCYYAVMFNHLHGLWYVTALVHAVIMVLAPYRILVIPP